MAEPRLTLVDRAFAQYPEPESDDEKKRRENVKKVLARHVPNIIKLARPDILEEGRQMVLRQLGIQRVEEASAIADLKREHQEQLKHTRELWGRGERWQGRTIGLVVALLMFAGGMWTGKIFTEQGFAMRVASERVCRAGQPNCVTTPMLQDNYAAPVYPHDRREPGDAP